MIENDSTTAQGTPIKKKALLTIRISLPHKNTYEHHVISSPIVLFIYFFVLRNGSIEYGIDITFY